MFDSHTLRPRRSNSLDLAGTRMHRVITAAVAAVVLAFGSTAVAQSFEDPQKQKAWDELKEAADLNDKRGMEKAIRKNQELFKAIFNDLEYQLGYDDGVDAWKRVNMLGELLDTTVGNNECVKRLEVVKALSLEDRVSRSTKWQEFYTLRIAIQSAWKNRENEKVNELSTQLITLGDEFQKLNDQLLRGYSLSEVAKVLFEAGQQKESLELYKQIDEGLSAQGYERLVFHAEVKKRIDEIGRGGGGGAGGSGASGGEGTNWATKWAKDAEGKDVPWSDPVPLKYTADEKLPWSKLTTPACISSEDTVQWLSWGLKGNGPTEFNENFKPLGRKMIVKRDGSKVFLDEDGDGKFREVKVNSKPGLVEVEKEFEDPWTKQKVKQKYAFLFGTGAEEETFFGLGLNSTPSPDYFPLRYSAGCYLKGTVLGLEVKIIDDNVSGSFGDAYGFSSFYAKDTSIPMMDAMQIGTAKFAQPFSEFIEVGGEFYRLKMSTPDEAYAVKTRKLDVGETGTVVLDFKNKVKPEALILSAVNAVGAHFNVASGKPVRLPVDRYKLSYGILRAGKRESMQSCVIVASNDMAAIEVKAGVETKIELGAPFHFVFDAQETGNGDVKIVGNSVAVKGRGGELYLRFWDVPPVPEAVQLFRDGKAVGKPVPMQRGKAEDYNRDGFVKVMFPLDLTLAGNGSQGKLGVSMKLKKPALLDGPIENKPDDKHE